MSIRVWARPVPAEDISVPFGNFVWPNGTYTEWSGTDWWVVLHPERTLPPAKAQSKRVREGKELIASPDGRLIAALFDDEPAELISVQSGERVDWPGGKTPIAGTSPAFGLDAKNRLLFAYAYSEGSDSQGHIYVGVISPARRLS